VLGTGGLAPLMAGESETITTYVPDLTLLGLRLTYLRNPSGSRPDGPARRSSAH
jgi:type III pantothenate kinase